MGRRRGRRTGAVVVGGAKQATLTPTRTEPPLKETTLRRNRTSRYRARSARARIARLAGFPFSSRDSNRAARAARLRSRRPTLPPREPVELASTRLLLRRRPRPRLVLLLPPLPAPAARGKTRPAAAATKRPPLPDEAAAGKTTPWRRRRGGRRLDAASAWRGPRTCTAGLGGPTRTRGCPSRSGRFRRPSLEGKEEAKPAAVTRTLLRLRNQLQRYGYNPAVTYDLITLSSISMYVWGFCFVGGDVEQIGCLCH